jgi:hypothetical protein
MPFDPTKPAANTPNSSAEMRAQLTGLKDLIDANQTISNAVVDGTSTLPPGNPATVTLSVSGNTLHISFAIPRGEDGSEGMPGPPFSSAVVDGVNTLNPGQPATVDSTFDGTTVHFTFGIPQGNSGNDGGQGPQGEQGIQGYQGQPGEVTLSQLDNAIAGVLNVSSNLSNAVSTLDQQADSSYNQAQIQAMLSKLDELILALRR